MKYTRIYKYINYKWNYLFFDDNVKINAIKHNRHAIPIVIVDKLTNTTFEYESISKAAKYFDTYPKTLWRKMKSKEPYQERYYVIAKYEYKKKISYIKNLYNICYIMYLASKNSKKIRCIVYSIFLIILIYIVITCIMVILEDLYANYTYNIQSTKSNILKYSLEHRFRPGKYIDNIHSVAMPEYRLSKFVDARKDGEFLLTISKNNMYKNSMLHKINLDFNSMILENTLNNSPIMERININDIFSDAIRRSSINSIENLNSSSTHNSSNLGINNNHRYYSIVDGVLVDNKIRTTELLNYNSNILYILINGISPSTY